MPTLGPALLLGPELLLGDTPSGQFTQGVLNSLNPWLQRDPQGVLYNLIVAFALMFEPVAQIVMDQASPDDPADFRAGWSQLLDPDECPSWAIPFGAAFVGVTIPPNTPEAEARAIWKNEAGFSRGTPAAMVAAAKRFLTGSQSCLLLERTPTPYSCQMVMRPEQVTNQTALQNAVLAVKPAGIVLSFVYSDGEIWNVASRTWNSDTTTWNAKG